MARTIVHEMVHEIGILGHKKIPGTSTVVFTAGQAEQLADKKPFRSGLNPVNYQWFFFYNADLRRWRRDVKRGFQ